MAGIPQFKADAVLFDVDGTIVEPVGNNSDCIFLETLRAMVQRRHALQATAADSFIRHHFDPQRQDPGPYLEAMGLNWKTYFEAVLARIRRTLVAFPDAVQAIQRLHRMGYRLYPATTNGRTACLTKLAVAGLADWSGSEFFNDVFGGSQVVPEGKIGPRFFEAILERIGADPRQVVMVGDDPQSDLANAKKAGIQHVVLVRRQQAPDWVIEDDGGLYVKSLLLVTSMVHRVH